MMSKLLYTLGFVLALGVAGCASEPAQTSAHSQADAEAAIMAAEHSTNRAAKVGHEWRDTRKKVIGKAKDALKAGDYDGAVKLANQAKYQSDMAYQQYLDQQSAGPRLN